MRYLPQTLHTGHLMPASPVSIFAPAFVRFRTWCVCVVVLGMWLASAAQAVPRNPRFENLGSDDGLPTPSVEALLQDHDGYIWIGTGAGLARYDGFRFRVYRRTPGAVDDLGSNLVLSLLEDRTGAIWVGASGGLYRLDPDRRRFDALDPGEPEERGHGNRTVRTLLSGPVEEGKEETIWAATADGLQRIEVASGRFSFWHRRESGREGLASDDVFALAWDGSGRLWIGTDEGLDRLDPASGRVEHFDVVPKGAGPGLGNSVSALHWDEGSDTLWIGTRVGLTRWSFASADAAPIPQPDLVGLPSGDAVRALFRDKAGVHWVGTQNSGLYRVAPGADAVVAYRHHAQDPHSLADDSVVALLQDRSGTLWIGTWYNGISRLDLNSSGFERYFASAGGNQSLDDNLVYHVVAGADGSVWMATLRGGIHRLDPATGVIRHYRHDPADVDGLPSDWIRSAAPDQKGRVWVGTQQHGFGRLDPDSGRYYPIDPGDVPSARLSIRAIEVGHDGTVWFGSEDGLIRYDPESGALQTFVHDPERADSLAPGRILALHEDRDGTLWIGSETGLDRMLDATEGRFEHFRADPDRAGSLSQSVVTDIFHDARGRHWIATVSGLNLLQPQADGSVRFHVYSHADGLANDGINAIQADAQGHLWLSTDAGVSRLDPETGQVRNYSARDGVTTGSFFVHSGTSLPDGTIFFGGTHGAVSFHPEQVRDNDIPPPVRIVAMQVSGREIDFANPPKGVVLDGRIDAASHLRLSRDVSDFTLEFAALHFADPTRNRFAYKLEGFDREFIHTDAGKPRATYTNLDPGRYVFKVKAANKDGIWNEEGARLSIEVLPAWWETWWVRVLAAASAIALLGWLYRRRIAYLDEQRSRETLLELSIRDPLTGLYNRRRMQDALSDEIERCGRVGVPLALLMIDVDRFKHYNDMHGHAAGDEVLRTIARALQAQARGGDSVCRYGGEEFAVLMPETGLESAWKVARGMLDAVRAARLGFDGVALQPATISIGMALFPADASTPEALLVASDAALYRAKREGRDRIVCAGGVLPPLSRTT